MVMGIERLWTDLHQSLKSLEAKACSLANEPFEYHRSLQVCWLVRVSFVLFVYPFMHIGKHLNFHGRGIFDWPASALWHSASLFVFLAVPISCFLYNVQSALFASRAGLARAGLDLVLSSARPSAAFLLRSLAPIFSFTLAR